MLRGVNEIITMEQEILRVRNRVVFGLAIATGVIISLTDEQDPATEPPYGYYGIITPYASTGEFGSHTQRVVLDPQGDRKYIEDIRAEYPEIVLSFTFCSANRKDADGKQVFGENEAMLLAMKAAAWLLHDGREALSDEHIVVLRVGNAASRSGIVGDEYVRRWGFDAAFRYKAMTARREEIMRQAFIKQKKEKEERYGS